MNKMYLIVLLSALMVTFCRVSYAEDVKSRALEFDYEVTLNEIPPDTKDLKIWMPHLPETDFQTIEEVKIDPEESAKLTQDQTYSNHIINYSLKSPQESSLKIKVHYKVKRSEFSKTREGMIQKGNANPEDLSRFLKSSRLVTLSPNVREIADTVTTGKETTMAQARAIYDYVFESVSYDKTIPGWGMGDTERVCLIKAGNCTDFHSLFISLARASGIPAKFVIGIPIAKENEGQIKGYHCWAEFYDEEKGWTPVDISEAWKHKEMKEYYFGTVDENRLEFTSGRDIILEPAQQGEPLNYFVFPYVEVDGKRFENFKVTFKYKDRREEKG